MRKFVRISFALIFFAIVFLLSHQSIAQPQIASNADAQAEAQRGCYQLIDMDELWQLYQQAELINFSP